MEERGKVERENTEREEKEKRKEGMKKEIKTKGEEVERNIKKLKKRRELEESHLRLSKLRPPIYAVLQPIREPVFTPLLSTPLFHMNPHIDWQI
jgi:hypothetical protein